MRGLGVGLSIAAAMLSSVLLTAGQAGAQPDAGDAASISGVLQLQDGEPVVAVKVSLFTANPDRTPDQFVQPAFTGSDGRFSFEGLPADCYVIQTDAPPGTSFDDGTEQRQVHSCVDPGQSDDAAGATLIAVETASSFELNLIHIGDHHSTLGESRLDVSIGGVQTTIGAGGLARVATKAAEIRTAHGAEPTLMIHSGGALGGTAFYSVFRGAADATVLNDICFDLFALGAQDLALGRDDVQLFLDFLASSDCRTEILGPEPGSDPANDFTIIRQQSAEDRSLEIRRFGDILVGFATLDPPPPTSTAVGVLGQDAEEAGLADLAESAQLQINRLIGSGVSNVVLITEIGFENDVALAPLLTGVDAIIGGGSNTLLGDFADLGVESAGQYPTVATTETGETVCIGHAWHDTLVVGEMNLTFDDAGRILECSGTAHLLNGQGPGAVQADPTMVSAVRAYDRALDSLASEPIGDTRERFCMIGIPGRTVGLLCGPDVAGDSAIRPSDVQRLIADSVRTRTGGADLAIVNSGAAAGGIPAGDVTIERIYRLLPNGEKLAALEMTGSEVVASIEEAIEAAVGAGGSAAAYPHATGLRWQADLDNKRGSRASDVVVRPPGAADWEPIDLDATYRVATIASLTSGVVGHETMSAVRADGRATIFPTDYAQAFIDFVEQDLLGVVSPFRSDRLN